MYTAREIADWMQGIVIGDETLVVDGMALMDQAGPSHLTYVRTSKDLRRIEQTKAQVIIVPPLLSLPKGKTYIKVSGYPEEVLHMVTGKFKKSADCIYREGAIHPSACIANYVSIGKGVRIGAHTVIHPNVTILDGVSIGDDCVLYPQVVIGTHTRIANRVMIHPGAVIGNDSFEFIQHGHAYRKVPNLGCVIIEDDVEIGANTTVDRGTIGNTIIRRGTKIDNLVQIAHEVEIGEHCLLAAQVGISGWTKIGHNTTIYGQSGVVGDIVIGNHVVIMGKSVVTKNIPDHQVVSGNPAIPHKKNLRFQAQLSRLCDQSNHRKG